MINTYENAIISNKNFNFMRKKTVPGAKVLEHGEGATQYVSIVFVT